MQTGNIKVSVIIPVYNIHDYIIDCLMSVVNQSLTQIEILVVNDGSTDNSSEIVDKFIEETGDKRIMLINQKNQGLSAARNTGASNANGEFLFFLDGDDWIDAKTLQIMYEEAERNHANVVICDYQKRYTSKTEILTGGDLPYIYKGGVEEILRLFLIGKIVVAAWNKLYRREWYMENDFKFPVGYLFEDISLTNLICNAETIVKLNEPFYNYRQREGSIMKTLTRSVLKKYDLVNSVAETLRKNNLFNKLNKEYQHFYNDLIVLQLVNGCLSNNKQNKKLSSEMIDDILSWPDTQTYFKDLYSNPYLKVKYKFALILLSYSPTLYKLLFKFYNK